MPLGSGTRGPRLGDCDRARALRAGAERRAVLHRPRGRVDRCVPHRPADPRGGAPARASRPRAGRCAPVEAESGCVAQAECASVPSSRPGWDGSSADGSRPGAPRESVAAQSISYARACLLSNSLCHISLCGMRPKFERSGTRVGPQKLPHPADFSASPDAGRSAARGLARVRRKTRCVSADGPAQDGFGSCR
jgi:hypothetical protein